MGGLFGNRKAQEQQLGGKEDPAHIADEYDEMVTLALVRLTRWAFPDSQVEREGGVTWRLWHLTGTGVKYTDVEVKLLFEKGKPSNFIISETNSIEIAKRNREDLDNSLRVAICSGPG